MMNDDKNSAGSGSFVLNAMDATEREEFETRLTESEELRNEITELTDTAVLLGMAIEPVPPPPALKQAIMARLGQTPQRDREESAPATAVSSVPPLNTARANRDDRAISAKAQQRWFSRPGVALVAAAAAVVLIIGGVVGTNLAIEGATTSQQASALTSIETASDVQRAEASVSSGGTVTLVWSLHLKKSALLRSGLAALPSDKTYELWYIDSAGTATPAGLFQPNGNDGFTVLAGQMTKGDTVGVTVEPSGGSKAPTTKPVVAIASA